MPSAAQIVPDRTLPAPTTVTTDGDVLSISGGTIAGDNLFHSFEALSVPESATVRFEVPAVFSGRDARAIGRVTGDLPSQIDGTISTSGPMSLVLINPNGIAFGSTARLDFDGSFFATTGDRLVFEDGSSFAVEEPNPVLTVSVPIGAQFNGGNGAIHLGGNRTIAEENETFTTIGISGDGLVVNPGQEISLLASSVTLDGALLSAPRGAVLVAGVDRGTVLRQSDGRFDVSGVETAGDVRFDNSSAIDTANPEGSGGIDVFGRDVSFINGSTLFTRVIDRGDGQGINITATETVDFGGLSESGGNSAIIAGSLLDGDGSDISISAGRVQLRDGGIISSGTGGGAGKAGNVTIVAREFVDAFGVGRVLPTAILAVVGNSATGDGGDITIEADRVRLVDGAIISAGGIDLGRGGNVTIRASDIEIRGSGVTDIGDWTSGIGVSMGGNNRGIPSSDDALGGSIELIADRVTIDDGAELVATAIVENPANTIPRGAAGNISVTADRLILDDGSTISTAAASGDRGNVLLNVDDVRLLGGSSIEASATSLASGGSIAIDAETLVLLGLTAIRADAEQNFAGRVTIVSEGLFLDEDSTISAESALGASFSGTVSLNTPELDTQGQLVRLSSEFAPPVSEVVANACGADRSVFYVTGPEGLPEEPDRNTLRPFAWTPDDADTMARGSIPEVPGLPLLMEATSWQRDRDRVSLVGDRAIAPAIEDCQTATQAQARLLE